MNYCAGCTCCCYDLDVEVLAMDDMLEKYIEEKITDMGQIMVMKRKENGTCIALDGTRKFCRIYKNRPIVCRQFECGSEQCNLIRKEKGLQEVTE